MKQISTTVANKIRID